MSESGSCVMTFPSSSTCAYSPKMLLSLVVFAYINGEWTNTEKQFQNYCGSWG